MELNDIVVELKQHDYTHFNEFYDLTNRQIFYSSLAILKDRDLAEDIMQETYIAFFKTIDELNTKQNIYAYLSIIARNLSINLYNKQKRVTGFDEAIEYVVDESKNDDESIEAILNLLDNDEEREIIIYHVINDYKFKDISRIINKPLGTTLWIYNKAIKKLKVPQQYK